MNGCRTLTLLVALFYGVPSVTSAQVWLCKRGNSEEYTNIGDTKNCRKIDLPTVPHVPASKLTSGASRNAKPINRPADFPKVDSGTQRVRDDDRRKLLDAELKQQESKLNELRKEFNNGQPERRADEKNQAKYQERTADIKKQIGVAEANIASIKNELSRLAN